MSLADLVGLKGLELIISEWGFGGGGNGAGTQLPPSPQYLVQHPFFGMWGRHSSALDPWAVEEYQEIRWGQLAARSGWNWHEHVYVHVTYAHGH